MYELSMSNSNNMKIIIIEKTINHFLRLTLEIIPHEAFNN